MQSMKELTNQQLFEDKNTIAWELISRYKYPFEVLPAIKIGRASCRERV